MSMYFTKFSLVIDDLSQSYPVLLLRFLMFMRFLYVLYVDGIQGLYFLNNPAHLRYENLFLQRIESLHDVVL